MSRWAGCKQDQLFSGLLSRQAVTIKYKVHVLARESFSLALTCQLNCQRNFLKTLLAHWAGEGDNPLAQLENPLALSYQTGHDSVFAWWRNNFISNRNAATMYTKSLYWQKTCMKKTVDFTAWLLCTWTEQKCNECDKSVNIFSSVAVAVPSSQFEFELSNTTVAQLDVKKSSVLGINIGYTRVTLVDKSILSINYYSNSKSVLRALMEIALGLSLDKRLVKQ